MIGNGILEMLEDGVSIIPNPIQNRIWLTYKLRLVYRDCHGSYVVGVNFLPGVSVTDGQLIPQNFEFLSAIAEMKLNNDF